MELTKITDSVRANLRERSGTSRFSDQALVDRLNDVSLEVSDRLQFGRKVIDITPTDGKVYLPNDLLRIERVSVNALELEPLSPSEAAVTEGMSTGGGYGYIWHDNYLQILPNYSEDVTIMYQSRIPVADNIDQDLDIPEGARMSLVFGITEQCFIELGDFNRAQYYGAKYQRELDRARRQLRNKMRKNSKSPFIRGLEV